MTILLIKQTNQIASIRSRELVILRQMAYTFGIGFTLIMSAAPVVLPVLIFYSYVRMGNELDAATAFTTISLFNILQFPFVFLPMGLSNYSQASVSVQRMLSFFQLEELQEYVDDSPDGEMVLGMQNASLSWVKSETAAAANKVNAQEEKKENYSKIPTTTDNKLIPTDTDEVANAEEGVNRSVHTLTDVSFSIKKGQLVAIVGPVGSGKSSLLSGLLGELNLNSGSVRLAGSVAYCVIYSTAIIHTRHRR